MVQELDYRRLKRYCDPDEIDNNESGATDDIDLDIIGQKRAEKALEFGLHIKRKGYNIFACGMPGTGKTTFAKVFSEKIAAGEKIPDDVCYVYNFKEPKFPKLLTLPAGGGIKLADEMDDLINTLIYEIPKVFSNKEYEGKKGDILKNYQSKKDDKIKQMTEDAKSLNFGVKSTNSGIYFMPIIEGELISEEQYDDLNQELKDEININSDSVQERATEIMRDLKEYEKSAKKEIEELEYQVGLFTVGRYVGELMEKYTENQHVLDYLSAVKEEIMDSIDDFIDSDSEEDDVISSVLPWYSKRNTEDVFNKYKVNVMADNSKLSGAPVIIEHNPTFSNLIGEVEYDNEYGNFSTDFMKIKPGSLHKANGGYLIIQAYDLFSNVLAWESLRRVLTTESLVIEPMKEYTAGITVSTIKPEALPINVKVILIGTSYYYDLIYYYDDNFRKIFKIRADFDYEMDGGNNNIAQVVKFVKNYVQKNNCKSFDNNAVGKIVEYSFRIAERQDKLTTQFSLLGDIILESGVWAELEKSQTVTEKQVLKAIEEREYRLNIYEEKLSELIEDNTVIIDTQGKLIGQINGLAVLDTGDYAFAKPSKITATTYLGKAGVINIEKESRMSGAIHDKGVQIISGYLGHMYAQEFPLSLSSRICFEQSYNGIDGDSASSTELYAILSSLAQLPINQEIAVTGSINQFGQIQPIGGATYKVEGFFDICNKRGLTGNQGVIIPEQNIKDLVLKDEVIEAVKNGAFHIYPIKHVDEGIEILMGVPAGKRGAKGAFTANSVHGKVMKKLRKFYKKSIEEEK